MLLQRGDAAVFSGPEQGKTRMETRKDRALPAEEYLTRLIPFRRVARPEDQAAAVSYLVSDDASCITGQVISD